MKLTQKQELILEEVKNNPRSAYRMSLDLGMSPQSVGVIMIALEKKGAIRIPSYMGKKIFTKATVNVQEDTN